tara:strand:- start:3134 stop:4660 length:1527 start_codon:yes stop_codon:yes gene_type:complete
MKLALMAMFKNEGHILYEFINHYLLEGVDHFILIDDNSDDNYYENNKDWMDSLIKSNIITIKKTNKKLQSDRYNEQIDFVKKFDWLIVCDLDEFMFSIPKDTTIKSLLKSNFSSYNYIRIPWKAFLHKSYFQPKSIIDNNIMTHSSEYDPTSSSNGFKYIVKPNAVKSFEVHNCKMTGSKLKIFNSCHNHLIQNNHYRTQSTELANNLKLMRGGGTGHRRDTNNGRNKYEKKYSNKKYISKNESKFNYECNALKEKRCNLIEKINNRHQIRPYSYINSKFIQKQTVIELNLNCGLCNRLQTIFYHLNNLQEEENLVVIWNWNKNGSDGNFYDYFNQIKNLHFIKSNKNYNFPIDYKGNGSDLNLIKNNYEKLKLNYNYLKFLENEKIKFKNEYIAIHVRRTDIKSTYKALNVKYDSSYDIYDKFINSSSIKNLYIATDNEDTYKYFFNKYKNSHLINNNVNFLDTKKRRKTSLSDSIIDLYMCIYSTNFLGTKLSSFTDFILNNRNKL